MAVAGKVAITFSNENDGKWSADVTYERLTAVTHNNNLYISKKTVANVEPTVTDEFWFLALKGFGGEDVEALIDRLNELSDLIQAIIDGTTQVGNAKTLDGHEADYFAPLERFNNTKTLNTDILAHALTLSNGIYHYRLGGGNYPLGTGLPNENYRYSSDAEILYRSTDTITVIIWGSNELLPIINNYNGTKWSGWQTIATTADLAKYLPLTGGTISNAAYEPLKIESTIPTAGAVYIQFKMNGEAVGELGVTKYGEPMFYGVGGIGAKKIFYEGNKPTGTYTGNGDATARTINTGGIGNMCLIYAGSFAVIATPSGAFRLNGDAILGMFSANCKFVNGALTIADASAYVNTNGWTYNYQVL